MVNNIKILYVEDDDAIRENTKKPLKYFSSDLFVASNGKEGLELYKQHKPDIVISDIKMPHMDGITMAKHIKEENPKQHIIFITAHSERNYFMDAIEMQVDGYILKPIDYNLLKSKIIDIKETIELKNKIKEQETLLNEIAKFQNNLLVVLDKNQDIIFSNEKFLEFFAISSIEQFRHKYNRLAYLFLEGEDFFTPKGTGDKHWIEQIQLLPDNKRIVSILDINSFLPKAFLVTLNFVEETNHFIILFNEITNIAIEKKEFKQKAFTDELTSIYNRTFFNEALKKEIASFKRDKQIFSFIIFDIDFFKKFNDTYGHQTGDDILIELANLIQMHTRDADIFARWGGEEFVKILPNTTLENALKVAEHLREIVDKHIFKNNLKVSCSFGVSQVRDNDNSETLIKRADDALYKAKQNGRNRVEAEI